MDKSNISLIINCNKTDIPNIYINKFKNKYNKIYINLKINIYNIIYLFLYKKIIIDYIIE